MERLFTRGWQAIVRGMAINRPLTVAALAMLATLVGTSTGLLVDPRVITGAPAWLKPTKFAISIAIYCVTFVWLLSFVRGRRRLVGVIAWAVAAGMCIEMLLIVIQVIRGTTSHFNVSTPFNGAIWQIMGASIVVVWSATFVLSILLLRQHFAEVAFAWALRFGALISLVGMGIAFFMTTPTSAQLAAARAGHGLPIAGAHSVGMPDGGPGLPILGWSTIGGDLRAPPFVGLHALQLLPLIGWLVMRYGGALGAARRTALVWIAGLCYFGVVMLLTWQALRGQSIIAPDARTLIAAGALAVAGISAALVVLLRTQPHTPAARIKPAPGTLA